MADITVTVGGPAHGGWCVGRHEGRAVFVAGTLPGETVTAEVTERRSKLWFARTVEVLEASPDRIEHIWPLAAATGVGGADLGHVALAAGRRWKAAVVATQLRRMAHLDWDVTVEAAPGDAARDGLAWRTRVEFTAGPDGRLGMFAPGSARLVTVDSMPLAHEAIQAAAPWAGEYRPGDRVTVVRASAAPVVLTAAQDDTATVAECVAVGEREYRYRLSATGFWQVHREAPGVLVGAVLEGLGATVSGPVAVARTSLSSHRARPHGPDTVSGPVAVAAGASLSSHRARPHGPDTLPEGAILDLYSGAGLFSVPLAERWPERRVVAVEGDPAGARWAAANLQDYPRATAVHGDVARVLATSRAVPRRAAAVVLDPPRAGAGKAVVAAVAARTPATVVFVACDPAAFARDVALFATHGYALTALRAFDLFPYTHHVECVGVLERQPG
ncbi:MAG: TRAM domain-containing protein [Propionibacteriaceae bacterium]|jgi:tRNA/tmRNA/rRNA uracil-C5-methylase (TrmA/RlmC/RlmD family)|nr:TRAM domain-containing protein [Propionibacteriaceae bacterium]